MRSALIEVSFSGTTFRAMRRLIGISIALLLGALPAGCGSHQGNSAPTDSTGPARTTAAGSAPVTTAPDSSNFDGHVIDNAWFPLVPGMTWTYKGVKDGEPAREIMIATAKTKTIQGVPSTVVSDKLYLSGKLEERTLDYYAQDNDGNVWYFGEDTAELKPNGQVKNTEGSWQAGRDGAVAGIFMPADPRSARPFVRSTTRGRPRTTSGS
jgi:hypothetical protein